MTSGRANGIHPGHVPDGDVRMVNGCHFWRTQACDHRRSATARNIGARKRVVADVGVGAQRRY